MGSIYLIFFFFFFVVVVFRNCHRQFAIIEDEVC